MVKLSLISSAFVATLENAVRFLGIGLTFRPEAVKKYIAVLQTQVFL